MQTFSGISNISTALQNNLFQLGYESPTEVQTAVIPLVLQGGDLLVQAKTGSGKTAAFGIPIMEKISFDTKEPQVLIITPTRELASQVASELRKLSRHKPNIKIITLTGGVPMRGQIDSIEKGAHIVVGTPGRLQDHFSRHTLPLFEIDTLVLDEADRMLDMGFLDAVKKITSNIRTKKQTLLFSATYPQKVEQLSSALLKNPETIKIEDDGISNEITQIAYETTKEKKQKDLSLVLNNIKPNSCLIFSNMRKEVENLSYFLQSRGFFAQPLSSNLDQRGRDEALIMFSNGTTPILVATDVASRGIDVKDIELVINYDLPNNLELYTHRIGRTGRAGSTGTAISLYTPTQKSKVAQIAPDISFQNISDLRPESSFVSKSNLNTICINGGRKKRLRAGDILGVLCKDIGINSNHIGKINIGENDSYVAVDSQFTNQILKALKETKIKNRKFKAWAL